ncbi:BAZ1A family protein [Megaselia abdita]
MPICMQANYEKDFASDVNLESARDTDMVFFCETTKKIFSDYDKYFRHVMVINSTVWICESSGKENLTYDEAQKSERKIRKKLEVFNSSGLGPVILMIIEKAQQASFKEIQRLVSLFIKDRYFVGEDIQVRLGSTQVAHKIIKIKKPNTNPPDGVYNSEKVIYTCERASNSSQADYFCGLISRIRGSFNGNLLNMYIKENVSRVEGILKPKPEIYAKLITDKGVSLETVFVGGFPEYKAAKPISAKQSSIGKYFTKNGENVEEAKATNMKSLKEEMDRKRKEEEAKQAEKERKLQEFTDMIRDEATELLKRSDDLERRDQKPFPTYHPMKLAVPDKYIGEFLAVKEFLHSFSALISGYNVFKNNISFYEISRAFLAKEVAGPLSDIILVLLGTVFDLQREEEDECPVDYIDKMDGIKEGEIYETALYASHTQKFVQKYYAIDLNRLPMDAQTVSEVLRLHFLASGAYVKDKAEKWRVMYRNGYYNTEDPGLIFRLEKPHILKALKEKTIYELPFHDVLAIINCLINQILTYSATINVMAERMESTSKAKFDLRNLVAMENKRIASVTDEKKKLTNEFLEKCNEEEIKADEVKKQSLENKLNRQIAEIMANSEREKHKFEKDVENLRSNIFDYMVYLGLDRAYRKYYVFESLPGIFIEHSDELANEDTTCFENPPENIIELSEAPHNKKECIRFLKRLYTEKNILNKSSVEVIDKEDDKENVQVQTTLNGGKVVKPPTEKAKTAEATPESLFICTGDRQSCLIHNKMHPKKQRWSYICEEEEIDALIDCLNPLGDRESLLKQQLTSLRVLIIDHVKKCPSNLLDLETDEDVSKFKIMMTHETNKKYSESNFAKDESLAINEIMRITLLERILKLEDDISSGNLGSLKISDEEKWRQDLYDGKYDAQAEIKPRIESEKPYSDPAINLGERKYEENCDESSSDELNATVIGDFNDHLEKVKQLANALIQVEQGIEQRFLKEPFGSQKEIKDKTQAQEIFEAGRDRLGHWEMTVLNATSYSQIFLNLNILHDAIKWRRSTKNTSCSVCRRKSDPEKLLLCDECNAGTHMFCMKPKLKAVPEGNWFCDKCVAFFGYKRQGAEEPKKKRKRQCFKLLEEEDNQSTTSSTGGSSAKQRKRLSSDEIEDALDAADDNDNESNEDAGLEDESSMFVYYIRLSRMFHLNFNLQGILL